MKIASADATLLCMAQATIMADPVLRRFRDTVSAVYGDRVQRVVLYGSRARGQAGAESDYDIAVFFRTDMHFGQELFRLADIGTAVLEETGEVVHAMPFPPGAWSERTPLMHEIRLDGVDL
ncbi:nucleotidyltransferase domain-containing protein [Zavarzinia sp. CC-PAN008]|uniref:nucleotidyltransferase domain-containing protein n=1 Tax=Zavarzinia sp. CC-PAN008 TaxID=3243332 RepID=UPI003F742074